MTRPDYAIAHENLGDIYVRLAGAEYDRAIALDKANKSAQSKLVLVRELFAVAPSSTTPKPAVPQPAPACQRNRVSREAATAATAANLPVSSHN